MIGKDTDKGLRVVSTQSNQAVKDAHGIRVVKADIAVVNPAHPRSVVGCRF